MKRSSNITSLLKMLTLAFAAIIIASCNTHKEELASSNNERDSLLEVLSERDSTVNDFLQSYNEIQQNLDSVTQHGVTLSKAMANQTELRGSAKQRINDDIVAINLLMNENRKKIASLSSRLKNSSRKNVQLEKLIESLNNEIVLKDYELEILNDRLAKLSENVVLLQTSIDTMTVQNLAQTTALNSELHTAYYVIGKSKDLEKNKVIDKKGGLMGMGKTANLTTTFDNNSFTKIDYTQVNSIATESKDVKVITTHPGNSFVLEKDANEMVTLRITDAVKFWSASKYLVILKD